MTDMDDLVVNFEACDTGSLSLAQCLDLALWVGPEVEIEARAWEAREAGDSVQFDRYMGILRGVVRAKLEGTYESKAQAINQRLSEISRDAFSGVHATMAKIAVAFERDKDTFDGLRRLRLGLESPDAREQDEFRAFADAFGGDFLGKKTRSTLKLLKAPRKRTGRPSLVPPWRNVDDELQQMRSLIWGGATIANAAKTIGGSHATAPHHAKHLEDMFSKKAKFGG